MYIWPVIISSLMFLKSHPSILKRKQRKKNTDKLTDATNYY